MIQMARLTPATDGADGACRRWRRGVGQSRDRECQPKVGRHSAYASSGKQKSHRSFGSADAIRDDRGRGRGGWVTSRSSRRPAHAGKHSERRLDREARELFVGALEVANPTLLEVPHTRADFLEQVLVVRHE